MGDVSRDVSVVVFHMVVTDPVLHALTTGDSKMLLLMLSTLSPLTYD